MGIASVLHKLLVTTGHLRSKLLSCAGVGIRSMQQRITYIDGGCINFFTLREGDKIIVDCRRLVQGRCKICK